MPGLEVVSAPGAATASALIEGGGGVEKPIYQNSRENSPVPPNSWATVGATMGVLPPTPATIPGLPFWPSLTSIPQS